MPTGRVTEFLTERLMTECMVLCFSMLLATTIAMMPLQPQSIPIMPWMVVKRSESSGELHLTCFKCFFAELPRLEVGGAINPVHYSAPPCISHNGFLFKTASMTRGITERKAREGS